MDEMKYGVLVELTHPIIRGAGTLAYYRGVVGYWTDPCEVALGVELLKAPGEIQAVRPDAIKEVYSRPK